VLNDALTNASNIVRKGRLGPGQMVCADLELGTFQNTQELAREVAAAHPYSEWLKNRLACTPKLDFLLGGRGGGGGGKVDPPRRPAGPPPKVDPPQHPFLQQSFWSESLAWVVCRDQSRSIVSMITNSIEQPDGTEWVHADSLLHF